MLPPLRGRVHPVIRPHHLNSWARDAFWQGSPLIADDWFLALQGTDVRWDVLALYHWCRTDFGRRLVKDPFGIGFEGSPEETVVNAAIRVTDLAAIDELPGDQAMLQRLALLWERWQSVCDVLIRRMEQGQPMPEAPKPVPPKPAPQPTPAPVEAPKPTPAPEKSPTNWKAIAGIVSGVAAALALVTKLTPNKIDDAIVAIIKLIAQAFGG